MAEDQNDQQDVNSSDQNNDNNQQRKTATVSDYPANTPVAEMTSDQQIAYWKHQSRKHEDTVKARSDYDALKAKAAEHDKAVEERKSEHDKALDAARDEGRAAAHRDANEGAATAILRAQLSSAGKTPEEVEVIVGRINPSSLLSGDDVDTAGIASFASQFARYVGEQHDQRPVDLGQGRTSSGPPSGDDAFYNSLFAPKK